MKGASLEQPALPAVLLEQVEPADDTLGVQLAVGSLGNNIFEVAVRATLTLSHKGKTLMVLEAEQGGLVQLVDVPASEVDAVLAVKDPYAGYIAVH